MKRKKIYGDEQANSNPNNISPTMSRRHIICFASDEPHKAFKVMKGLLLKWWKGLLLKWWKGLLLKWWRVYLKKGLFEVLAVKSY